MIEIINIAQEFCSRVDAALQDVGPLECDADLRSKLGLCRNLINYALGLPNADVRNPVARDSVSKMITAMTWVAFYAKPILDYRTHRELIKAQALFMHILGEQIPNYARNGGSHSTNA